MHWGPLAALAPAWPGGLAALGWTALKVGALSFGGGFVIIPLMQGDAVHAYPPRQRSERSSAPRSHSPRRALWLSRLGQVTPGPVVATVAAVGPLGTTRGFHLRGSLDQLVLKRVAHQLRARAQAQLLLDVGPVGLDGAHREVELLGDLSVGMPERDHPQHLDLAL